MRHSVAFCTSRDCVLEEQAVATPAYKFVAESRMKVLDISINEVMNTLKTPTTK